MKDEKLLKLLEKKFERDFYITTMQWSKICLERTVGENGLLSFDVSQYNNFYNLDICVVETHNPVTGYVYFIKAKTIDELIKKIKMWRNNIEEKYNDKHCR